MALQEEIAAIDCIPTQSVAWMQKVLESQVILALDLLGTDPDAHKMTTTIKSPASKRGVYAKVDIDSHCLFLYPYSTKVNFETSPPQGALSLGIKMKNASGKTATAYLMPQITYPEDGVATDKSRGVIGKEARQPFLPHYWLVQEKTDLKEINMKKETTPITLKLSGTDCNAYEKEIVIPYMTNTRSIREGEHLAVKKDCKRKRGN